MHIDSSGNVGIGTSSPTYPLTVDTGAGTFSVRAKGSSSVTIASDASMTYFANTHEFYNSFIIRQELANACVSTHQATYW